MLISHLNASLYAILMSTHMTFGYLIISLIYYERNINKSILFNILLTLMIFFHFEAIFKVF